jgi:hypothetical protein
MTVFVSAWDKDIPAAKLKAHGPANPEAEAMLAPCGGDRGRVFTL